MALILQDISGRCLKSNLIVNNKGTLLTDVSFLQDGLYFYSLVEDGKSLVSRKMIRID